ncbi:hypothetical protein [Sphingomonas crusticola]|uniref:hypothetical protein n=1 Tax=Sphingomonas crusticola TaxID=1697973 RepID=UPI000E22D46A|nr:hypothetical protein [Sphingomonas crusticola]
MTKTTRWMAGFASLLLLVPVAANAADDPFLGSWRLDKAKSVIAHDPGVKTKQFVFSPNGEGVMITETLEMEAGNGEKQVTHLPYVYGKFTPQPGPGFDALSVVKTDSRTALWTAQAKGKIVAQLEVVVSGDGKEMTFRYLSTAADPTGAVTKDRYVYDKE